MPSSDLTTVRLGPGPGFIAILPYGTVVARTHDGPNEIVHMPASRVGVYCICGRRPLTVVFRTVAGPEHGLQRIAGISMPVRRLLYTRTRARFSKVCSLFRYLVESDKNPCSMSDGFYLRVGALLAGRLPRIAVLESLVSDDEQRRRNA